MIIYDVNNNHKNLIYKRLIEDIMGKAETVGVIGHVIPVPKNPPAFVQTSTTEPSATFASFKVAFFHSPYSVSRYFKCEISLSNTHGKPCKISLSSFVLADR